MKFFFKPTKLLILSIVFILSGCSTTAPPTSESNHIQKQLSEFGGTPNVTQITSSTFTLPVLGFHHIGPAPSHLSKSAREWYIDERTFLKMLTFIKEKGYTPITATELIEAFEKKEIAENPIMITFDDGNIDFFTTVFPILKKKNIPVTLAIMTGVGGENFVNKEQIKEMHNSGLVDIQSHTKYHAYLTRISKQERAPELQNSKDMIEKLLNKKAEALIYPFGLYNDDVIQEAKDIGYKIGITIKQSNEQSLDLPFEIKRHLIVETSNLNKILE